MHSAQPIQILIITHQLLLVHQNGKLTNNHSLNEHIRSGVDAGTSWGFVTFSFCSTYDMENTSVV